MRFVTKRQVLIALIDKLLINVFKSIFTLKEPFSRIGVKSELVLSLSSLSFGGKSLKRFK